MEVIDNISLALSHNINTPPLVKYDQSNTELKSLKSHIL